jgi:hypothetical protein
MANGGIIGPINDPTSTTVTTTFTASGTLNTCSLEANGPTPGTVDYLVVAGGGGGGANHGGGGGAGGYRTSFPGGTKLSISSPTSVTVGAGGSGVLLVLRQKYKDLLLYFQLLHQQVVEVRN